VIQRKRGGGQVGWACLGILGRARAVTMKVRKEMGEDGAVKSFADVIGNTIDFEGAIYSPSEIILSPIGIIDTSVDIDPDAWVRAVKVRV
jgi:hypothetical protein